MGERGGVAIDDHCRTSDPAIRAIGECASHEGRVYGLVAPGYRMAEALADVLTGADTRFEAVVPATKLKLLGVDVAACGDSHGITENSHSIVWNDPAAGVYKKIVLSPDARRLIGCRPRRRCLDASHVGDDPQRRSSPSDEPGSLIAPNGAPVTLTPGSLGASATVCSCLNVNKGRIVGTIVEGAATDIAGIKACTKAGTGAGSCVPILHEILRDEMAKAGKALDDHLCEHFPHSRQHVFDLVRTQRFTSFNALVRCMVVGAAARSASRPSHRCSRAWPTGTSSTASKRPCKTRTTTSSRTCNAMEPTRSSRAFRAVRSHRLPSSPSGR
jgi:nitrite reductase (NADH) large subunit